MQQLKTKITKTDPTVFVDIWADLRLGLTITIELSVRLSVSQDLQFLSCRANYKLRLHRQRGNFLPSSAFNSHLAAPSAELGVPV